MQSRRRGEEQKLLKNCTFSMTKLADIELSKFNTQLFD